MKAIFVSANRLRQFDLVCVRFCAGNPIRRSFARILKADLDVVESGVDQRLQPLFVESEARGDEVGVESRGARGSDQFRQIGAGQRFAAGEVRVQHAEFAALLEHARPLLGRELRFRARQFQRIRAIDAVQRAAVRDFGDEGERVGNHVLLN